MTSSKGGAGATGAAIAFGTTHQVPTPSPACLKRVAIDGLPEMTSIQVKSHTRSIKMDAVKKNQEKKRPKLDT